jgi:hypothetical protein
MLRLRPPFTPRRIVLQPEGQELQCDRDDDGYLVRIPSLDIHRIVEIKP